MKNIIISSGPSAGGTIRQLFRKIRPDWQTHVIPSYDDYSHGPLSTVGTSNEFILERHGFWQSLDLYDADYIHDRDLRNEHNLMVNEINKSGKAEIWVAGTVQDFMFTVVTLRLLKLDGVDISNVLIRDFSDDQVKWGLGVVNFEELETLYNSSKAIPFDPKIYNDAWDAISQGSGAAIASYIEKNDPCAPMVKALSSYLLRFPEYNGGLGSIERSLLGAGTDEMKKSTYTIGYAMAIGKPDNDMVGDLLLFKRLVDLSKAKTDPWFRLEGDLRGMRSCSAQITDSGKKARVRFSVQAL